jgi:hypothetical protein
MGSVPPLRNPLIGQSSRIAIFRVMIEGKSRGLTDAVSDPRFGPSLRWGDEAFRHDRRDLRTN